MREDVQKLVTGLSQEHDDALFTLAETVAREPVRAEARVDDIYDYVLCELQHGVQLHPLRKAIGSNYHFVLDDDVARKALDSVIESLDRGVWSEESAATIAFRLSNCVLRYAVYLSGQPIGDSLDEGDGSETAI